MTVGDLFLWTGLATIIWVNSVFYTTYGSIFTYKQGQKGKDHIDVFHMIILVIDICIISFLVIGLVNYLYTNFNQKLW